MLPEAIHAIRNEKTHVELAFGWKILDAGGVERDVVPIRQVLDAFADHLWTTFTMSGNRVQSHSTASAVQKTILGQMTCKS